jgi:hypothetical protein
MTDNLYQNGKVYIIYSTLTPKVYIGSTIQNINTRFLLHKSDYKRYNEGKIKKYTVFNMFDEIGIKNCKIQVIKYCYCSSKTELEREEGYFIKTSKNCYNKNIAGRSQIEYRNDNQEKRKEYYQKNQEKIKKQVQNYYQKNQEKIKKQNQNYYQNNKEKLKLQHNCKCGSKFTTINKSKHLKTQKHQNYLTNLE